jgi:Uma2 family endonuclease
MHGTVAPIPAEPKTRPLEPVSFEAFLEWVDEDTHAEWVDGQIIMTSPASDTHQMIRDFLVKIMGAYVETRHLGWLRGGFLMKTEVRPSGREPDILFVAEERRSRVTPTYLDGPADLVVEIVSPDSAVRDRGEKFIEYEAVGIPEYWLLDPLRQEALFYQRGADGRYHPGPLDNAGAYHALCLPGFWLKPDWLWQQPLPDVTWTIAQIGGIAHARAMLAALRDVLGHAALVELLGEGEAEQ